MKKLMTLALVALSAAALQAVTATWTGSNNNTAEVSTYDSFSTGRSSATNVGYTGSVQPQTFSVAVVFNGTALSSSSRSSIVRFFDALTGDSSLSIGITSNGLSTGNGTGNSFAYATGVDSTTVQSLIGSGNNTLVSSVVAVPTSGSTNLTTTVTYYLNGVLIGTTTYTGSTDANTIYLSDSVTSVYYATGATSGTAYNSSAAYTDAEIEQITASLNAAAANAADVLITNLVPEPTCLALLALGVAGLALKRRVA